MQNSCCFRIIWYFSQTALLGFASVFYVLWFFIHFNEFIRSYQIPLQHHTTSILQISQIHPFWLTASPSPLQLPWHTLPNMCAPFFFDQLSRLSRRLSPGLKDLAMTLAGTWWWNWAPFWARRTGFNTKGVDFFNPRHTLFCFGLRLI